MSEPCCKPSRDSAKSPEDMLFQHSVVSISETTRTYSPPHLNHLTTNLPAGSRILSGLFRRSLPPCTAVELSSTSAAGSAACPKYRFSFSRFVDASCIIPPDLLPSILQAVRRVLSRPRVRLAPTVQIAFPVLSLASPGKEKT
ncbi:unnamed protein product [Arabidopsis lyrata]|nr:unnamed protein product [Arabidopsis lyrata]